MKKEHTSGTNAAHNSLMLTIGVQSINHSCRKQLRINTRAGKCWTEVK